MLNLWTLLTGLAWPMAKKILTMLGIGWLTYEGLTAVAGQAQGYVISNFGSLPASMLQVLSLSGFAESVGIILGAVTARLSFTVLQRLGKLTT